MSTLEPDPMDIAPDPDSTQGEEEDLDSDSDDAEELEDSEDVDALPDPTMELEELPDDDDDDDDDDDSFFAGSSGSFDEEELDDDDAAGDWRERGREFDEFMRLKMQEKQLSRGAIKEMLYAVAMLDTEEPLAKRTRRHAPIEGPIEDIIEVQDVPPELPPPPMPDYELEDDDARQQMAYYHEFLMGLQKDELFAEDEDDADDAEFNYLEYLVDDDRDEYRDDFAVCVTHREYNELVKRRPETHVDPDKLAARTKPLLAIAADEPIGDVDLRVLNKYAPPQPMHQVLYSRLQIQLVRLLALVLRTMRTDTTPAGKVRGRRILQQLVDWKQRAVEVSHGRWNDYVAFMVKECELSGRTDAQAYYDGLAPRTWFDGVPLLKGEPENFLFGDMSLLDNPLLPHVYALDTKPGRRGRENMFTVAEDRIIAYGLGRSLSWTGIAAMLPGRTGKQVWNRLRNFRRKNKLHAGPLAWFKRIQDECPNFELLVKMEDLARFHQSLDWETMRALYADLARYPVRLLRLTWIRRNKQPYGARPRVDGDEPQLPPEALELANDDDDADDDADDGAGDGMETVELDDDDD